MVVRMTHYPKIKGSNPATGTIIEKMAHKIIGWIMSQKHSGNMHDSLS